MRGLDNSAYDFVTKVASAGTLTAQLPDIRAAYSNKARSDNYELRVSLGNPLRPEFLVRDSDSTATVPVGTIANGPRAGRGSAHAHAPTKARFGTRISVPTVGSPQIAALTRAGSLPLTTNVGKE